MKKIYVLAVLLFLSNLGQSQTLEDYLKSIRQYEPSEEFPYGKINPEAPEQLNEFDFMVGVCDCTDSISQGPDKWLSFPSIWSAKYFLNGHAIQDNNFNPKNPTSNLRLYDKNTGEWKVTFTASAQGYFSGVWTGKKENDEIILYQKNGDDQPYSKLTFYDIGDKGYKWKSETVYPDGQSSVGWKKICVKR